MDIPTNLNKEIERIAELRKYDILDSLTEHDYEDITFMASIICNTPIALISFVDGERQWFKSHKGIDLSETAREYSFCAHALDLPSHPMIITDSRKDDRFKDNPFVTGAPNIVFYAGFPLVNEEGFGLGSVCVIDTKPRELTSNQIAALKILSSQVMNLLEMRKSNAKMEFTKIQLEARNKELEQAAKKLEESESQLKTMSEGMDVLLAMSDATSKAVYFTKAWATLTGKTIEELLNFDWTELIHPDDRERYTNIYLEAFKRKGPFSGEFRIMNKYGKYTWLLSQGSPQILADGSFMGYISSTIEITELKEVETNLAMTAKRLQLALDAGKLGSYELELETGNMKTSARCNHNFGFPADVDLFFPTITAMILPEDVLNMQIALDNSIKKNITFDTEYRIMLPSGEMRWIHASGVPMYNEEGKAVRLTGVTVDITAQKIFESALETQVFERTKELEEKNIDLDRMNNELKSFAYISSHDLQEPLRKIQTFSTRIINKEAEGLSEKAKDYFMRIQHAAIRMQNLINDLLAYSRTATTEKNFEQTDLKKMVSEVIDDLREEIELKNATIEALDMCIAKIIPFQFKQLLQNLFTNSLKFSKVEYPPHIKISSKVASSTELKNEKLLRDINYCHITVADNGIGFDEKYNEKIFELFQRLHGRSEYDGTGIGLAIVKKIVDNHNGVITANAALNEGAKFDIYLPVSIA